jgi:hypothetical protein
VAEGRAAPRDASLAAGRLGAKALPEAGRDAPGAYGVTARQGRAIVQRVTRQLQQPGTTPGGRPAGLPAGAAAGGPDPEALVGAEIALSGLSSRDDGFAAMRVIESQSRGTPVRRGQPSGAAVAGRDRTRQYRLRRHIAARITTVALNPGWSVGAPFMVLPMRLEPRLMDLVPARQRRRGRPPDADWLAAQASALARSYSARDGSASDLARIVTWGFAQHPASPDENLEADALRVAAAVARESGGLGAYWLAERIRYLVGHCDRRTLTASHDSVIVLRNHGYRHQSRQLLDQSLAALARSEIPDHDRVWIDQLLLSLATHYYTGANPILAAETARSYARRRWMRPYGTADTQWDQQARRAEFEIEYAAARRRSHRTRQRFWLHAQALRTLEAAEHAMRGSRQPMYLAQWALLRMRVGIDRRDSSEVTEWALRYAGLGAECHWILIDHPSELHEYRRYRQRATAKNRALDRALPMI